jgi:hypothetical protein
MGQRKTFWSHILLLKNCWTIAGVPKYSFNEKSRTFKSKRFVFASPVQARKLKFYMSMFY